MGIVSPYLVSAVSRLDFDEPGTGMRGRLGMRGRWVAESVPRLASGCQHVYLFLVAAKELPRRPNDCR